MFGSIKKKLTNAIQGGVVISESLQQQYRQRSTPATTPTTPISETICVNDSGSRGSLSLNNLSLSHNTNITAGCELLEKYEADWKDIRDNNEANAQKAEQLATQIEKIEQCTSTQHVAMSDLTSCLAGMPALVKKLQESSETLKDVIALSATVEEQLLVLEDLCDECDMQEWMFQKQFELSQYKQKKMASLELYRQKVAAEHQEKIRLHEERLRQIQRERQAVFDDAFRVDLEEFKQKGVLPKIHKTSTNALALEQVDLEDSTGTKDALEDFLNG